MNRKQTKLEKILFFILFLIMCIALTLSLSMRRSAEGIAQNQNTAQKIWDPAKSAVKNLLFTWKQNLQAYQKTQLKPSDYNSYSIYVYNLTDEKRVAGLNENERVYPASLVKIMTVYVALKEISEQNMIAPVDPDIYRNMVAENASMAGFVGGEQTKYRDLLYGTLLASGGECAESLAINSSGSLTSFVDKMNEQAKLFSLKNTHFANATGLDHEKQFSSAKDITMLLKECLKDETFYEIFTSESYLSTQTEEHPHGISIKSTVLSKLPSYECDGFQIIGGKSGTTDLAGLCWASMAVKNDNVYLIVVMGTPYENINSQGDGQIRDTIKILKEIRVMK